MELPYELKTLPPHAIDVIQFLDQQPEGHADAVAICEGANLSNRAFGKAIRRLVTRNYLNMDAAGFYRLTPEGRKAAKLFAEVSAEEPADEEPADEEAAPITPRRLTIVIPKTLSAGAPAQLYAGIDRPQASQRGVPTSLVLRLEGVNCNISPAEHTLEVPPDSAAAPAASTLTALQSGQGRVRVRAYQLVREDKVEEVGGMYFDFLTDDVNSADLQAISTDLNLHGA